MKNNGMHTEFTASTAGGSKIISIGVPQKGENSDIALRKELKREDTDEVLEILNGRGKKNFWETRQKKWQELICMSRAILQERKTLNMNKFLVSKPIRKI